MSTLYVWFPASWARMVAERLFSWSPHQGGPPIHSMVGPPQSLPRRTPERILGTNTAAGSSEAMEETDSTDVKYKIRQWSLPDATIVPVLNVSSRVFWLELEMKLSWTAMRCYRRVSFVMCFAEVFCCVAGRSRRKAYSWYHAVRPSRCG